jgi:hypothetical protein
MASGSQEGMDADGDCQNNKDDQADGYEKNGEDFYLAAGDYQHSGASVSLAGAPRNITDRGYGGADGLL